ncbi:hypothetical protein BDW62DRAFT_205247 [Aspergillus aurantiobrunneus]
MSSRTAEHTRDQMPPACQQPRPAFLASFKKYRQRMLRKLKKLSPVKLNQLVRRGARRDAAADTHCGQAPSSPNIPKAAHYHRNSSISDNTQSAPQSQLPRVNETNRISGSSHTVVFDPALDSPDSVVSDVPDPSPGGSELDGHLSAGYDVLLKLPGDSPEQTQPAAASLDTQLRWINLMRRGLWDDRLNEHGRGELEPVHDVYVKPMGSGSIPVVGVVRRVEWLLKNGARTYISDFHVVDDDRFDILIGDDTIKQYRLLQLGDDLRQHGQTTVKTTASNPKGHMRNAYLDAIVDDTIEENIIPRKCLEQLQGALQLTTSPLGFDKTLHDSHGASYMTQNKVLLLIKPCDGPRTEKLWFYVAESTNTHVAGGYDIILAKSWKQKFGLDDQEGKVYPAAPTELRKGKTRQERKEWDEKASEHAQKNLADATQLAAQWEKDANEQKEKGKGPSNRQ